MILDLRYYGDPILRKKCKEVEKITPEIRTLVEDMIETMDAKNGIGISACQVGRLVRIFVLRNYVERKDNGWVLSAAKVFINPKILSKSEETILDVEGCLSIPRVRGHVLRPLKVTVQAMDLEGNTFVEDSEGYNARVRFHENDHLNGVLFIDRLSEEEKTRVMALLQKTKT
ncbi:MAG: peptide deformylase [Chlamydiae bacterium]|nr:peptide deformylase [Chlamydiota bacterium]